MERGTTTISEGIRVLIVDDDPAVATVAQEYLGRDETVIDSRVETDPHAALDAVGPALDVVVSDFDMPRMNGLELRDAIDNPVPFVLFTGSVDTAVEGRTASSQVDAVVEKQGRADDYERLIETVRNVV